MIDALARRTETNSQSSEPRCVTVSLSSIIKRSARLPSELCPFAQKTPRESLDVRTHARHDGRRRRRCVTISRAAYRRGLSPGPRLSCHVVRDAPRPNLGITADRVSPPEIAQLTRTRRPRPTRISPRTTPRRKRPSPRRRRRTPLPRKRPMMTTRTRPPRPTWTSPPLVPPRRTRNPP